MADSMIMVRNGGSVRIVSERKFHKWFEAKGYAKVSPAEVEAYNKAKAKPAKKAE